MGTFRFARSARIRHKENTNALKLALIALPLAIFCVASSRSGAGSLTDSTGGHLRLVCQNGHEYPIRARAITDRGEMVTGSIWTGRRHTAPLRLIPMGLGYRYAGPGIWFEGLGADAVLNTGRSDAVPCSLSSE